jgi:hypothetical protein
MESFANHAIMSTTQIAVLSQYLRDDIDNYCNSVIKSKLSSNSGKTHFGESSAPPSVTLFSTHLLKTNGETS